MAVQRMWLLNCGWLRVEASLLMYRRDFGKSVTIPVTGAVLESDDGYFVFDTGLNPDAVAHPEAALGNKASTIARLDEGHDIRRHMAELGISAGDVRWLANSHLHWDHTGGNRFFPSADVLIQREELRFARDPDAFVAQIFLASQYALPDEPTVLDGDHVVADGIGLISTRGHTPGHQSLLVRLASGRTVLCTGDAAYRKENLTLPWPPGNPWGMPDAYRSLRRMQFFRDFAGAEIVVGHEPTEWDMAGERIRELS